MLRELACLTIGLLYHPINGQSLFPSDFKVSVPSSETTVEKRPGSIIATKERSFIEAPESSSNVVSFKKCQFIIHPPFSFQAR